MLNFKKAAIAALRQSWRSGHLSDSVLTGGTGARRPNRALGG